MLSAKHKRVDISYLGRSKTLSGLQTFARQDVWGDRLLDDHLGETDWTFRRQQLDVWAAMNICSGKRFSSSESTSKML